MTQSDAIFVGTVKEIREEGLAKVVTFQVSSVWKGSSVTEARLFTEKSGEACGFVFNKGNSYLVFVKKRPDRKDLPYTGLCSRTALETEAAQDIKVLGKPKYIIRRMRLY